MRSLFVVTGLAVGALCGFSPQLAQAAPGEVWDKPAGMRLQDATSDDFLVELGRAADINVIADVTQPPADDPAITAGQKADVGAWVDRFVTTRDAMATPFDEQTMLFWAAPDFAELVRMIRAKQADAPKPQVAPLAVEAAPQRWEEYFRQSHKWDGNWQGVDIKVAVDDLPADLRSQLHQEIERRFSQLRDDAFYQRRTSDEFWTKGRLYIDMLSLLPPPAPLLPHVVLWDFTRTPFPGASPGVGHNLNVVYGPLPAQARR